MCTIQHIWKSQHPHRRPGITCSSPDGKTTSLHITIHQPAAETKDSRPQHFPAQTHETLCNAEGVLRPDSLPFITPEDWRSHLCAAGKRWSETSPGYCHNQDTPARSELKLTMAQITNEIDVSWSKDQQGSQTAHIEQPFTSCHNWWADNNLKRTDPSLQIWPNHQSSTEDELVEDSHTEKKTYALYIRLPKMSMTFSQASIARMLSISINVNMM